MNGRLVIEGSALVLRDAYLAGLGIRAGDAVRIVGNLLVGPTSATDSDCIGVAVQSASVGQPVAIALLGLARILTATGTADVVAGDVIVPAETAIGKGKKASSLTDLFTGKAKRYAFAVEPKASGKPVWVHLKPG